MTEEGTPNLGRTSREQMVCYLYFIKRHPEMKTTSGGTIDRKRLWAQLARKLNDLPGPRRTPVKWKETLAQWKNQVCCRIRKKAAKLFEGPISSADLAKMEQRKYDSILSKSTLLGSDKIIADVKDENDDSLSSFHDDNSMEQQSFEITRPEERTNAPMLGFETVTDNFETILIKPQSRDSFIDSLQETPTNYPIPPNWHQPNTNDESQFRAKKLEMYGVLVEVLRSRDESDKKFREESLKCQQSMTNAMNNMAASFLAISQALISLSKEKKDS